MRRLPPYVLLFLAFLSACDSAPTAALGEKLVTLPGGRQIVAEVMSTPDDMARGMMYRDSLASDRGMLFLHQQVGKYPYWMRHCRVPLDIVWIDSAKRVVEVVPRAEPCYEKPVAECPAVGGNREALYVLELAGGEAYRLGLRDGVAVDF